MRTFLGNAFQGAASAITPFFGFGESETLSVSGQTSSNCLRLPAFRFA